MVIGLLLMITHDINAYVACISVVVCLLQVVQLLCFQPLCVMMYIQCNVFC